MLSRASFWLEWVLKWEGSGLSQAAFCRRHRLSYGSFASWKRRLIARGVVGSAVEQTAAPALGGAAFVEVTRPRNESPRHERSASPEYELVLAGGHTLRLSGDFDASRVRALVEVLESC